MRMNRNVDITSINLENPGCSGLCRIIGRNDCGLMKRKVIQTSFTMIFELNSFFAGDTTLFIHRCKAAIAAE